ncbi:MAG: radical SAM protein [Candidatus Omnitrophica bacterium]|nr:radical SAM protein [Candidatus Omnitrophota bacterium]
MILYRNFRRFYSKALIQPAYALRVFKKRLLAYLYHDFAQGRSSPPESVTLFLTHRCNLHCKMCGQWGEGGVTKKQSAQFIQKELGQAEISSLIDDLSGFRPNITLFGGEPLLFRGCVDLIRQIKQKGMHCLIITNGFLLEEMAKELVESGLDELNVSLDGSGSLHDEIRGMPGLFDKIMRGLKQVDHFKSLAHKNRPLINLQCTVTKFNYRSLEQMLEVAAEAKAESLTFHNLIFTNKEILDKQKDIDRLLNCSSADWEGFDFDPGIDPAALFDKMREILSAKVDFSVDFYPNFSRRGLASYYENAAFSPKESPSRCLSPWIVAYIFPDGEVRPCLNCSYSFGNIREDRFLDIWNSKRAIQYRKLLKKNRLFPACVRCTELYRY